MLLSRLSIRSYSKKPWKPFRGKCVLGIAKLDEPKKMNPLPPLKTSEQPKLSASSSNAAAKIIPSQLGLYVIKPERKASLMNPRKIREHLDEYVIGQDGLKKTLAVAIYNHYLRLESNSLSNRDAQIGPTGCGKTLISKKVAELVSVPFSMNDATPFTQAGYVGEDAEQCIARLLQASEYDVSKAERGIVFIDEIDKLARRTDATSNQRDVSGEGVQQSLLRMLEGTIVTVTIKGGRSGPSDTFQVNTQNILFICSGAFVGLNEQIARRLGGSKSSIGFGAKISGSPDSEEIVTDTLKLCESDDIIQYGFIPEFVGRIPIIASATQLREEDLLRILTEPKLDLQFHEEALQRIASVAATKKTGARGLRRICEIALQSALYEYPGTDVRHLVVLAQSIDGDAPVSAFTQNEHSLAIELLRTGSKVESHKVIYAEEEYSSNVAQAIISTEYEEHVLLNQMLQKTCEKL